MTSRIYAQTENRLSVNELEQTLQKMADAFMGTGTTPNRSSFEKWKKRYQKQGVAALNEVPRSQEEHPHTTRPETIEYILKLSLKHPSWGCVRIAKFLKDEKHILISSPTVQKMLIKQEMGSREARLQYLQAGFLDGKQTLSDEQVALIELSNPSFREREIKVSAPGETLLQDTFFMGNLPELGKCYLHAVVDTYSSYAFAFLHTSKSPEPAVAVLHNEVLPFYAHHNIDIQQIISDSDKEFAGKANHAYQVYMMFNDVNHRQLPTKKLANGHMEYFKRCVKSDFKIKDLRCDSLECLQEKLASWLDFYNEERTHEGFPNREKTPVATFKQAIAQR